MNAPAPFAPVVPAQFTGLARQFRHAAGLEHNVAVPAFEAYTASLVERLHRHPGRKPRDGMLRHVADSWRAAPHKFRLAFHDKLDRRGRTGAIVEVRIEPMLLSGSGWEGSTDRELSLCVVVHRLAIPPIQGKLNDREYWASVSLHALARRYQRCSDHSHKAIMEDLAHLIRADLHDAARFPEGEEFRIVTPRGAWLGLTAGTRMPPDDELILQFAVRTFIDRDAVNYHGP